MNSFEPGSGGESSIDGGRDSNLFKRAQAESQRISNLRSGSDQTQLTPSLESTRSSVVEGPLNKQRDLQINTSGPKPDNVASASEQEDYKFPEIMHSDIDALPKIQGVETPPPSPTADTTPTIRVGKTAEPVPPELIPQEGVKIMGGPLEDVPKRISHTDKKDRKHYKLINGANSTWTPR